MSRPKKCRRVCHFPGTLEFFPAGGPPRTPPVTLTVDEYEAIRLIDREGLSQEQCSQRMGVARTTVQQIYAGAREKLARFLVDGLPLRIEGGDFTLCGGEGRDCGGCFKRQYHQQYPRKENLPCASQ